MHEPVCEDEGPLAASLSYPSIYKGNVQWAKLHGALTVLLDETMRGRLRVQF